MKDVIYYESKRSKYGLYNHTWMVKIKSCLKVTWSLKKIIWFCFNFDYLCKIQWSRFTLFIFTIYDSSHSIIYIYEEHDEAVYLSASCCLQQPLFTNNNTPRVIYESPWKNTECETVVNYCNFLLRTRTWWTCTAAQI